jgi:protein SCO1
LRQSILALSLVLATGLVIGTPAFARNNFAPIAGAANEVPKELEGIGITEHRGDDLDLGLKFRDEKGQSVRLGDYFKDGKPVLLTLAYYGCPSLCNYHVNGINDAFKQMKAPIGQEFKFVVVSIEPKETPALAAEKKAAYLKAYGRPETADSWHFLTGDLDSIAALAKQVGFNYRWDAEQNQYAHAAAAYVITPEGRISQYYYGIVFPPKDLRLSMIEASNGNVGTIVDKITLYCFHFDPKASKFTIAAFNIMRAGGALMVLIIGAFLVPFWFRRDRLQGEA